MTTQDQLDRMPKVTPAEEIITEHRDGYHSDAVVHDCPLCADEHEPFARY